MIRVDTSLFSGFASCVSESGKLKVIWMRQSSISKENLELLDLALEVAYYDTESKNKSSLFFVIDMTTIKFVYFFGGIAFYFQQVPDFKKLKELIK